MARRLPADEFRVPLAERPREVRFIVTARVSPEASGSDSLVGASFCGSDPEGAFAQWMQRGGQWWCGAAEWRVLGGAARLGTRSGCRNLAPC